MQDKTRSVQTLMEYLDTKENVEEYSQEVLLSTSNSSLDHTLALSDSRITEEIKPQKKQSEMWPEEQFSKNSEFEPKKTDQTDSISEVELAKLRDQLSQAQLSLKEIQGHNFEEPYSSVFRKLMASGITRTHASVLLRHAEATLNPLPEIAEKNIMRLIQVEISKLLQNYQAYAKEPQTGPRMITLIGGTGVGKTTTLMKIASKEIVKPDQKVALISMDRYGMGGNRELEIFSDVTSIPLYKPLRNKKLVTLKSELQEYDVVIVDTPGRSPNNKDYIEEIQDFHNVFNPSDILLTISLNSDIEDIFLLYESYLSLKPSGLIFTKLDETKRMGKLITMAAKFGLPIAYICDGQTVTGNIFQPESSVIWNKLIETIECD